MQTIEALGDHASSTLNGLKGSDAELFEQVRAILEGRVKSGVQDVIQGAQTELGVIIPQVDLADLRGKEPDEIFDIVKRQLGAAAQQEALRQMDGALANAPDEMSRYLAGLDRAALLSGDRAKMEEALLNGANSAGNVIFGEARDGLAGELPERFQGLVTGLSIDGLLSGNFDPLVMGQQAIGGILQSAPPELLPYLNSLDVAALFADPGSFERILKDWGFQAGQGLFSAAMQRVAGELPPELADQIRGLQLQALIDNPRGQAVTLLGGLRSLAPPELAPYLSGFDIGAILNGDTDSLVEGLKSGGFAAGDQVLRMALSRVSGELPPALSSALSTVSVQGLLNDPRGQAANLLNGLKGMAPPELAPYLSGFDIGAILRGDTDSIIEGLKSGGFAAGDQVLKMAIGKIAGDLPAPLAAALQSLSIRGLMESPQDAAIVVLTGLKSLAPPELRPYLDGFDLRTILFADNELRLQALKQGGLAAGDRILQKALRELGGHLPPELASAVQSLTLNDLLDPDPVAIASRFSGALVALVPPELQSTIAGLDLAAIASGDPERIRQAARDALESVAEAAFARVTSRIAEELPGPLAGVVRGLSLRGLAEGDPHALASQVGRALIASAPAEFRPYLEQVDVDALVSGDPARMRQAVEQAARAAGSQIFREVRGRIVEHLPGPLKTALAGIELDQIIDGDPKVILRSVANGLIGMAPAEVQPYLQTLDIEALLSGDPARIRESLEGSVRKAGALILNDVRGKIAEHLPGPLKGFVNGIDLEALVEGDPKTILKDLAGGLVNMAPPEVRKYLEPFDLDAITSGDPERIKEALKEGVRGAGAAILDDVRGKIAERLPGPLKNFVNGIDLEALVEGDPKTILKDLAGGIVDMAPPQFKKYLEPFDLDALLSGDPEQIKQALKDGAIGAVDELLKEHVGKFAENLPGPLKTLVQNNLSLDKLLNSDPKDLVGEVADAFIDMAPAEVKPYLQDFDAKTIITGSPEEREAAIKEGLKKAGKRALKKAVEKVAEQLPAPLDTMLKELELEELVEDPSKIGKKIADGLADVAKTKAGEVLEMVASEIPIVGDALKGLKDVEKLCCGSEVHALEDQIEEADLGPFGGAATRALDGYRHDRAFADFLKNGFYEGAAKLNEIPMVCNLLPEEEEVEEAIENVINAVLPIPVPVEDNEFRESGIIDESEILDDGGVAGVHRLAHFFFDSEAFPDGGWEVRSVHIEEALNEPYLMRAEIFMPDVDTVATDLLGRNATIRVERQPAERYFYGVVRSVEHTVVGTEGVTATLEISPALYFLSMRKNTRIFQEKTAPEILEEVLNEALGPYERSVELQLVDVYPTREYCLQFRELDLDFVHRLLEEEGITYYFKHEEGAGKEVMVLVDDVSAYPVVPHAESDGSLPWEPDSLELVGTEPVVRFELTDKLTPTSTVSRNYDWSQPVNREAEVRGEDEQGRDRELYEHGRLSITDYDDGVGKYQAHDADRQSEVRTEARARDAIRGHGLSRATHLAPGTTFMLSGHPAVGFDQEYLVRRVVHENRNVAELIGHDASESGDLYVNDFACIPKETPHRPDLRLTKPQVTGVQTATVVGPGGEEIHVDQHGRIKVRFHWDRGDTEDPRASCWIRVMQAWAGNGWGTVFIPRIGMEVIVTFLDGDPDRPLVTGCVYNGQNRPPYPLPDEKTKSTIKSNSSVGGGGFNEFRFEDKKGQEEIYTHAQKDYNEVVENDHNTLVHNCQTNEVDVDQTETIHNDQFLTVDNNRTLHIKNHFSETIDGGEDRTVSAGSTETIHSGETRTVDGGFTETITGGETRTVSGGSTETIDGGLKQMITGGETRTILGDFTETVVGASTTTVTSGITFVTPAAYVVTAVAGITLATPAAVVVTAPAGITQAVPAQHVSMTSWKLSLTGLSMSVTGMSIGVTGMNMATTGLSMSQTGLSMSQTGLNMTRTGLSIGQTGLSLTQTGISISQVGLSITL